MVLAYYDLAAGAVPRVRAKPLLNKQFAASLSVALTDALDALGFNLPPPSSSSSSIVHAPCAGALEAYFTGCVCVLIEPQRSLLETRLKSPLNGNTTRTVLSRLVCSGWAGATGGGGSSPAPALLGAYLDFFDIPRPSAIKVPLPFSRLRPPSHPNLGVGG
jgi:hypothetical protein